MSKSREEDNEYTKNEEIKQKRKQICKYCKSVITNRQLQTHMKTKKCKNNSKEEEPESDDEELLYFINPF